MRVDIYCHRVAPKIKTPQGRCRERWQLIPSDIYGYMSCGAFVSVQTAQCLFSLTHCRTKQQIVAWSNCASHEPKIKPAKRRVDNVLYQVRLPHFVKTSCGTPSRELFRFGLPAHRHRREGWLGQLIPSDIYEYMSCGETVTI